MSDYNLGTASGKIVVDGRGAQLGFNVAQTAASSFFNVVKLRVKSVTDLGKRMAAVGAGGVAGFGIAVKVASAFQKQMSGVYAVANANTKEMDQLRAKALQLGKDTQYSASEAASALEEIIKAGVSTEDAINGAADATVALAAAGGLSLPEAATIAANAMNAFQISAKELPKIADVLAGVANTSAADVTDIGQSFQQVSAVAHLAGLSFRDTAIAIGEMSNAGIKGSDAGTSLKTMLSNLIPVTDKQQSEFYRLGLISLDLKKSQEILAKNGVKAVSDSFADQLTAAEKVVTASGRYKKGTVAAKDAAFRLLQTGKALNNNFFDQSGKVKNLRGLQEALQKSLKGMTKEQQLASVQTLFGSDAMRASAILALQGAKGYDKFSKAVSKTKASDVAKTRMNNLSGSVEQFRGSLETVQIEIGSVVIPILTKLVKAATWVLNKFLSLPNGVRKAIIIFGLIASSGLLVVGMFLALLPAIAAFIVHMIAMKILKNVIGSFRLFFTTLHGGGGVLAATRASVTKIGTAAEVAGKRTLFFGRVLKSLRAAFLLMTGPVGILIAVVLALAAIGFVLYKKYKPFHDLVDRIAKVIREKFLAAWVALQPVLKKAGEALVRIGQFIASSLMPVLVKVGGQLLGKLFKAFTEISKKIQGDLLPAVHDLADVFQKNVVPAASGLWTKLQPLISAFLKLAVLVIPIVYKILLKLAQVFIKYILPILIKFTAFLLGEVIGALVTFINGCIDVITGVIKIFTGLINFFSGLFTGNWSKMWKGLGQIFSGAWKLIIGIIKIAFTVGLLKAVGLGFRGLLALGRLGIRGFVGIFRGSGGLIAGAFRLAFRLVIGAGRGIIRLVVAVFRNGFRLIPRVINGVRGLALKAVGAIGRGIVAIFRAGIRGLPGLARNAFMGAVRFARSGLRAMVTAVRNGGKGVLNFFRALPGRIFGLAGKFVGVLKRLGVNIIEGMVKGMASVAHKIIDSVLGPLKKAYDLAQKFLHIGSPSKLFKSMGRFTGMGYIVGVEDTHDDIEQTGLRMATKLIDGYNKMAGSIPSSMVATLAPNNLNASVASTLPAPTSPQRNSNEDIIDAIRKMTLSGELKLDPSLMKAFVDGRAQDAVTNNNIGQARNVRRNAGV